MSDNMTIENHDLGSVAIGNNEYQSGIVEFPGADTYEEGTILGRLTATSKFVAYDSGGSGGAEIPKAVLNTQLIATGAGDVPTRPMISGKVRADKLIIHGTGPGVGITDAVKDQLRDYGIIAMDSKDLSLLDNQ